MTFWRFVVWGGCGVLWLAQQSLAAGLDPQQAARHTDELLSKDLYGGAEGTTDKPAAQANDQTFLRRASLDLVGRPPTPDEITAFALDASPDKRANVVERLLASRKFGENWGRYWRDVIMFRRNEDRALIAGPAAVKFLSDALNDDPHWDKIARKVMTATGDVRVDGSTALIMAQMANAEDTTAEISRIFMGIQIQCAQCHNHPTDRWKREQFHELAAFFPRIAVRPLKQGPERTYVVSAVDKDRGKKDKKPRRGTLEHHMPDLNHPDQEGKLMTPVFFVTGQKLEMGRPDGERREKIAEWITSRGNHWFAKAFVNRMWSELVGHGFYEPVDDIGPDRNCSAPHTLEYLSEQFAAEQYDVKWLLTTIMATEAYQRESRSRFEEEKPPFVASCPQRLRGDQLYDSLLVVLGIGEPEAKPGKDNYRAQLAGPRGKLNQTFGYDPSAPRDELVGSIPQALFLMNAPELSRGLNGHQPQSSLGQLLGEVSNDEEVVEELYLRALAREPKQTELQTCVDHVRTTGDRVEAFEDILWSLVNSTEFLNRK